MSLVDDVWILVVFRFYIIYIDQRKCWVVLFEILGLQLQIVYEKFEVCGVSGRMFVGARVGRENSGIVEGFSKGVNGKVLLQLKVWRWLGNIQLRCLINYFLRVQFSGCIEYQVDSI